MSKDGAEKQSPSTSAVMRSLRSWPRSRAVKNVKASGRPQKLQLSSTVGQSWIAASWPRPSAPSRRAARTPVPTPMSAKPTLVAVVSATAVSTGDPRDAVGVGVMIGVGGLGMGSLGRSRRYFMSPHRLGGGPWIQTRPASWPTLSAPAVLALDLLRKPADQKTQQSSTPAWPHRWTSAVSAHQTRLTVTLPQRRPPRGPFRRSACGLSLAESVAIRQDVQHNAAVGNADSTGG